LHAKAGCVTGMAVVKGRAKRRGVSDNPQLAVRISPANFDKVERMADALGVSKAAIVDEILSRELLDEHGRPPWWTRPVPQDQQELPLQRPA